MGVLEKVGWDSRGGMKGEDRILHPAQAVYVTIMNTYNKRREHNYNDLHSAGGKATLTDYLVVREFKKFKVRHRRSHRGGYEGHAPPQNVGDCFFFAN